MKKILISSCILFAACTSKPSIDDKINSVMNESEKRTYDSISKTNVQQATSIKKGDDKTIISVITKEPKVKEAIVSDAGVLYVSVLDDGTRRDGYAEYLTSVISDYNTNLKKVKVVKFGSTKDPNRDNDYGVLLGEADCK